MKKLLLTLAYALFYCISAFSQATSLTVDCQNPGWLSSKINYGDQSSVKKMKVTGYVNETDLKFLVSLIVNRNLKERLDLSEVHIVGEDAGSPDNYFPESALGQIPSGGIQLKTLILPNDLSTLSGNAISYFSVDTLYYNSETATENFFFPQMNGITYKKHVIFGDNVKTIARQCFAYTGDRVESVTISSSIETIEFEAFANELGYEINVQFLGLQNLKYLGGSAFCQYMPSSQYGYEKRGLSPNQFPDTLYLPKIKHFEMTAIDFKQDMHLFLGENIEELVFKADGSYDHGLFTPPYNFDSHVVFHLASTTPPLLTLYGDFRTPNSWLIGNWSGTTIYVPKSALKAYNKAGWQNANFIAEKQPVTDIQCVQKELILEKGESSQLIANVLPEDADNPNIRWESENAAIVSVNQTGLIHTNLSGKVWIYAKSEENENIKDSCLVTVIQHAESVTLDTTNVRLFKIGDTYQLTAIVSPENTNNKTVTWESTNQSVCRVNNNGLVTAVGLGSSTIIATTQDGAFQALCVVLVKSMPNITSSAIEWDYNTFTYTGNAPQPTWRNTMTGLQVSATMPTLKKNVGTWEEVIPFTFKDEVDEVTLDIHFNYTIQPATLTIKALDATRNYGEENPTFSITYEGFVGGENERVLTKQPVIGCSANNESAPGEYPITVSGAEATNYQIQYVAGKLLVKDLESFKLIYMVDGAEYCRFTIKFKDPITPLTNIAREGYTFSGWSEIPTTMPSHDVVVVGSFTANKYKIRYYVGEQLWAEDEVEYGAKLTLRDYTPADANRYSFAGWDGVKFETMPAKDIEYHAMIVDGIYGLNADINGIEAIYDGTGRKLSKMQRGVNVLRMKDGTTRKVFR